MESKAKQPWLIVLAGTGLLGLPEIRAAGFPEFPEPRLQEGRRVFLGTCEACHANSLSEAPQVNTPAAWAARLAQGRDALYRSALQGRTGSSGEEMPPRGGNAGLSDAEVKSAVDYMLKLITTLGEVQ